MLEYKSVALSDREWIEPIFKKCGRRGNEYTFANLYNWSEPLNIKIARLGDTIVFKHVSKGYVYSCPIGRENLAEAVEAILEEGHEAGQKITLVSVDEFDVGVLHENFSGRFQIEEVRDNFDYIYIASELGELKGRKYRIKRNHVNKFLKLYPDWKYEEINEGNIADVKKMAEKWYEESLETKADSLILEKPAVMSGLDNYASLGLEGGIIYVDGNIAAFCFGSSSSEDTVVVHCEKAFLEYEGVYTMIAKEFARVSSEKYKYVNREEDMGLEGLRISKLSYRPEFFYKRFKATEV